MRLVLVSGTVISNFNDLKKICLNIVKMYKLDFQNVLVEIMYL